MLHDKHFFPGVYIHIPFCLKKCDYCAFVSYAGVAPALIDEYVSALIREISAASAPNQPPDTVFFGGGTPTRLTCGQLSAIQAALRDKGFWAAGQERTIEANPGTVSEEGLAALREMGFNRINFGVQSFSDELLKNVGRLHTAEQADIALRAARQSGWDNIGLDLMYGLPGQTIDDFQSSLALAADSGVRHISVYGLTIEPDTALSARDVILPGHDNEAAMYEMAEEYLTGQGFIRYEIANYARPGYECKHNDQYWRYLPYRGFGLAAVSFDGKIRTTNISDLTTYINFPGVSEQELITGQAAMAEFVFMNLRRAEGFNVDAFRRRFGLGLTDVYGPALMDNEQKGFITTDDNQIRLTTYGKKYGNQVFMSFLSG